MFTLDQFSLEGKVALVTGVGARKRSIGEAYAFGLMQAGARLVVADISLEGAESAAHALIEAGGQAVAVKVDITDPSSVEAMAAAANAAYGGVDVLVNNAAIMVEMTRAPLLDVPAAEWSKMLDVNLLGAINCCRAIVPSMRARGGGKIVNQLSAGAFPPYNIYGVTKLALLGATVALAKSLGPDKINVNAIAPGSTTTEAGQMLTSDPNSPFRQLLNQVVAMRVDGAPDELVGALLLLCSRAGDWITGQVLNVDGGWILRP